MNSMNWDDSNNWNAKESFNKDKPNHSFLNKKRNDDNFSKKDSRKESIREEQENPESCEIFVRNLSFSVDEEALKEAFAKIGKVRFTKILKKEDGTSKGVGFVNFFSVEDAKNAICESENIKIDGRYVKVSFSKGKGNSKPNQFQKGNFERSNNNFEKSPSEFFQSNKEYSNNVFVSNLSFKLNEHEIKSFFDKFGTVLNLKMLMDEKSKFKGMCVISYEDAESIEKALTSNGHEILGRSIKVSVENSRGNNDSARRGRDNGYRGGSRGGNREGNRGCRRGGRGDREDREDRDHRGRKDY